MKFPESKTLNKTFVFGIIMMLSTIFIPKSHSIGYAPVRNFNRQTYGSGAQNWSMTQDARGRVYFGNRDGMLIYDGTRWALLRLPNFTTVRTVYADTAKARIYVGGSGEFGYFESKPPLLQPAYTSTSAKLPKRNQNFSEIWNILPLGNDKYAFQGDYDIFIQDGENVRAIPIGEKITASSIIGPTVYLGLQDGTIMSIRDGGRKETLDAPALKGKRIVGIQSWEPGFILISTAFDGLFVYDGNGVRVLDTEISPYLVANQIFSVTNDGETFVFGTVNGGAVVKNFASGATMYINKDTGLMDNTVLGAGIDNKGNLWLCLDNGIAYSMIDSPVYNLLGASSDAGAGYSSLLKDHTLYLGTNRGLYTLPYPFASEGKPSAPMKLLSGQVWSIDTIGQRIFFSTDNGVYTSSGRGSFPSKLQGIDQGTWYVSPVSLPPFPKAALASTYHGFYLLSDDGKGWTVLHKITGYDDAGGKFIQDRHGHIWLAHWIKGIYRLRLNDDGTRVDEAILFSSQHGLPDDRDNSIFLYDGEIRIATASGEIFRLDGTKRMVKDEFLSSSIPLQHPVKMLRLNSNEYFAFSPRLVWKIIRDHDRKIHIDSTTFNKIIASSLIAGFENIGMVDDKTALVSHQEGFYSVDIGRTSPRESPTPVFIEKMLAGDSLIFSNLPQGYFPNIKLPYSLNSLTFHFASPEYRQEKAVRYSYKLENYDKEWSAFSPEDIKEYTRLDEGKYTFRLKAFNTITGETSEYNLDFRILPPWYRSVAAKIIYGILLLAALYCIYRGIVYYSTRNAEKIRRQKEEELKRIRRESEQEALRKDYEIASLKSESLEQDIKHKSSELSNITMNVIRKNEILLDISSKLDRMYGRIETDEKTEAALRREIDKLQLLIRENISHDDDWKRFNRNFDIVYADFTKRLAETYPDLTVSELRLCCYLKMGLSSKEIAPLLNISSKSVEMNRYRLRKKMGLERETNLQSHLQRM